MFEWDKVLINTDLARCCCLFLIRMRPAGVRTLGFLLLPHPTHFHAAQGRSSPLSTVERGSCKRSPDMYREGKVNLHYLLQPFYHIIYRRAGSGVLKSSVGVFEKLAAIGVRVFAAVARAGLIYTAIVIAT